MKRGPQGYYLTQRVPGESFKAFVPKPLPPDPPLELDTNLHDLLEKANRALGRLDGVAMLLPDISLFLYFFVRREAVLSSQIEGTQSSLSDLLLFESDELPGVPIDDVREVSQYVAALESGVERIRGGAPLSSRLIREVHNTLLIRGRGSDKQPGEFRHSPNWIGGTRPGNASFVPPPHHEVGACMGALENFLHDTKQRTPTLIKAALTHVQFETIHPFLDGNGRIGRLLIPLLLCYEEALREPLLYLSYYFKVNKQTYYELLQQVRLTGDWEAWLAFFLEGVQTMADQAAKMAQDMLHLFNSDRRRIEGLGKSTGSVLRIHYWMEKRPFFTIPSASEALGLTQPTVTTAVRHLIEMGIIRQVGTGRRNRLYAYDNYIRILSEGTEPTK